MDRKRKHIGPEVGLSASRNKKKAIVSGTWQTKVKVIEDVRETEKEFGSSDLQLLNLLWLLCEEWIIEGKSWSLDMWWEAAE